jgi:glycosyltransferase involved in cell wall biosynthesis
VPGVLSGNRKRDALHSADVFVFPPRGTEGQPLVLLEAMSAGLPIVSTSHPGIADTVRTGVDGLLVDPGDVDGLAATLLGLIGDEGLRTQLGAAARQRYEDRYRIGRLRDDLGVLLLVT